MASRFIQYSDRSRRKIVKINNGTFWMFTIPDEKWCPAASRASKYWVKQKELGNSYVFRYGIIEKVNDFTNTETQCCICKQIQRDRNTLVRHAKRCHLELGNICENTVTTFDSTIREYGDENPRWFSKGLMYSIMGDLKTAIPKLVKHKHFNDDFPENKNLRLESRKMINKRLRVYEEGRWKTKDSKHTFYKVIIDIYDILCDALEIEEEDEPSSKEEVPENEYVENEIRKLHETEIFTEKLQKIKPLWRSFQDNLDNQQSRIDMWEDLKTLLLDRQLEIEQEKDH